MATVAERLAERLAARNVERMFGVPGGDCNLDVIDAAARGGIDFVLARTETAAAIMAAVTAELTGAPGVVMTTRGPGVTNAANGIAYADLDRAPVMLIADAYEPELAAISHQRLDQAGILRPMLRSAAVLDVDDPGTTVDRLLDRALAEPPGPVYLEITGAVVRASAPPLQPVAPPPALPELDPAAVRQARQALARARRPAIIAGLQACGADDAAALRRLVASWGCPVFTSYKAKGVASDRDPHTIGHYIGGASEQPAIEQADLLLLYGFDPVEHPPGRWRYAAPVVELTRRRFAPHVLEPAVTLVGDLAAGAAALATAVAGTDWTAAEFAEMKRALRARAETAEGDAAIGPCGLVEAALRAAPAGARVTVDSGAHMLPVLHLWRSEAPRDLLMSRGLATMGFALPAAIGAALAEPATRTIAFTGDGGLMMCAGELGTAVQNRCNLAVVVFNDASLTLIGAKQRRRQLPNAGVDFSPADFAAIAHGFGCAAQRVETPDQLVPALAAAFAADGPALVDVVVDPQPYHEHIVSVRG